MRKSRFTTEEQIAMALRQGEVGTPVGEIVRKLGISERTYYRWKKKYGGLGVSELRELKAVREENRRLKTLVADLSLNSTVREDGVEPGWMVADRENSILARRLIQQSCLKHGVQPQVLTLHSDRGAPMTSQCTAQLLADLGVTRSLSRPQVSDDNPFSEAHFKTLKYHPSFPGRFEDKGEAKTFLGPFFRWYNTEHRHGGISMLTPEQVHFGRADEFIARRTTVLNTAWDTHPERFVRGQPKPKPLAEAVWINPPQSSTSTQDIAP
jgi:transposase InsO family protein